MLEYVFFNPEPCSRFRSFLLEKGIASKVDAGETEQIVQVEEERIDDALADEVDRFYDEMFALDQSLFEESTGQSSENYHAAGVVVNLKSGKAVYAEVPPDLLCKVMTTLDPNDLAVFVDVIVSAVENPDQRSFCERMRDSTSDAD